METERKVRHHARPKRRHLSPPPVVGQALALWVRLPPLNRKRLLWMLSQLLERQLRALAVSSQESDDELVGSDTSR